MAEFTFDLSDAREVIKEAAKEYVDEFKRLKDNEARYKAALEKILAIDYRTTMGQDSMVEAAKEALYG